MRNRSRLLIILPSLLFFLAGCSLLAEDITPPPGYQYSTIAPVQPNDTPEPLAASPTATTPTIQAASAVASTQGVPSASIQLNGEIKDSSGQVLKDPFTVHLYLYDNNSGNVSKTLTTQSDTSGRYQFADLPADTKATYFAMVDYKGVTYSSDPVTYGGTGSSLDVPITVYDTTDDLNALSLMQVHMQFDLSTQGTAKAQVIYIIANMGNKSVIVQSDGHSIPFIKLPEGATAPVYDIAQGSAALAAATNGFAIIPGADKQYGIVASFSLPFNRALEITQPFVLPVKSETVMVPVEAQVSSGQLTDLGVQTFQSNNYHIYQGSGLASGSSLTFTLSGAKQGSTLDGRTIALVLIGLIGLVLIGLGIYFFIYVQHEPQARRRKRMEPIPAAGKSFLIDDKDSVIDAIIALDEQFKDGKLAEEAYKKRRDDLKNRLRSLL